MYVSTKRTAGRPKTGTTAYAGSIATVTFARTSGRSRTSTVWTPRVRSGSWSVTFVLSIGAFTSRVSASAISFVVTLPKVLPCSPALSLKTRVTLARLFASSSASPWARSFLVRSACLSCARCFSSPPVASMVQPVTKEAASEEVPRVPVGDVLHVTGAAETADFGLEDDAQRLRERLGGRGRLVE